VRILKVVQFYYPFQEKGGPVVKVRALAQALSGRGHRVTVLTADWGLRSRNGHKVPFEKCDWGYRTFDAGVEALYLPSIARYRSLTLNPRVLRFCGASLKGFDVVHFYGLYDFLGPAVAFYCRRESLPYLIEPIGMYRPIDRSLRRKSLWHRSIGRAFCGGARGFVATADLERQDLIDDGIPSEKILVRYNGVDSNLSALAPGLRGKFRQKWSIPPEEPLILFLSRLIPRKGADILIAAFARSCPNIGRLVIAGPEGESGYLVYLQKCAQDSGAANRIIFTGALYDQEKAAAFADADVFALPSRYENFANVVAEAMACGIPVLVSDSCGIASLVEGKAGIVIQPSSEAIVGALRRMLGDKNLYARFRTGCREVTDQLSWPSLAAQMEGFYAKAILRCSDSSM
jgi:glycosyltransferase involved in cell wall biosynthesis